MKKLFVVTLLVTLLSVCAMAQELFSITKIGDSTVVTTAGSQVLQAYRITVFNGPYGAVNNLSISLQSNDSRNTFPYGFVRSNVFSIDSLMPADSMKLRINGQLVPFVSNWATPYGRSFRLDSGVTFQAGVTYTLEVLGYVRMPQISCTFVPSFYIYGRVGNSDVYGYPQYTQSLRFFIGQPGNFQVTGGDTTRQLVGNFPLSGQDLSPVYISGVQNESISLSEVRLAINTNLRFQNQIQIEVLKPVGAGYYFLGSYRGVQQDTVLIEMTNRWDNQLYCSPGDSVPLYFRIWTNGYVCTAGDSFSLKILPNSVKAIGCSSWATISANNQSITLINMVLQGWPPPPRYLQNILQLGESDNIWAGIGDTIRIPIQLENADTLGAIEIQANSWSNGGEGSFNILGVSNSLPGFTVMRTTDGRIMFYSVTGARVLPCSLRTAGYIRGVITGRFNSGDQISFWWNGFGSRPVSGERVWFSNYHGRFIINAGLFGDVYADGELNSQDIVVELALIFGTYPNPTALQLRLADITRDGTIDISDLIELIVRIRNTGVIPPMREYLSAADEVNDYDYVVTNTRPIVGYQVDLAGNLANATAQLSARAEGMNIACGWNGTRLRVVVFSTDGSTIPSGSGPVFALSDSFTVIAGSPVVIYGTQTGAEEHTSTTLPSTVELKNYPNPFNPTTTISFSVPKSASVSLTVFDAMGRQVQQLINSSPMTVGNHSIQFDGSKLSAGVYFARIQSEEFTKTQRMVLTK